MHAHVHLQTLLCTPLTMVRKSNDILPVQTPGYKQYGFILARMGTYNLPACICTYTYMCLQTHTHMYASTCVYIHTPTCICTCTYMCLHTPTHMYMYIHLHVFTYTQPHVFTYMHTFSQRLTTCLFVQWL